jgi:CMP-N-acetylneuraminic acid synthetase
MVNLVKEKNIIAIIPARGGSKRIPNKNIVQVGGKPMIAWTIEAALNCDYISRVIVSTDDKEIATISKSFGAEVPFLREINFDDHSPVSLATIACLDQLRIYDNTIPDIVVQLMANCPLRGEEEIKKAIANFLNKDVKFQISCFKYGWMNPWWAHMINDKGIAKAVFDESIRIMRSQDQPELFCPTGAIWIAKTKELLNSKSFYGLDYHFFPMPWRKAIDIDDFSDLEMAEQFISRVQR